MHCRNCGRDLDPRAIACVGCGLPPLLGRTYCQNCGAATDGAAEVCTRCGTRLAFQPQVGGPQLKSRLAAGLLGVFLGWLGVHRFYLGDTGIGVAQLMLTLLGFCTCGVSSMAAWIWGFIEGILILVGSIDRDADGRPLRD